MKLSVAANYDPGLVPDLGAWPVHEVYGKLPSDGLGGGRPRYMAAAMGWDSLAAYVARLRRHGIAFNYLLNAACHGNREWSRWWQQKLRRVLGRLEDMGVSRLTVSTPFLLERIKRLHPSFHVRVGIYAQVDTPRRARFWESLGADAITLESFSINRRFDVLAGIRRAVRCELQLIANHLCLPNCPLQPYHQSGFSHGAAGSRRLFVDYCFLHCSRMRLLDVSLFIKSMWIRPEDTAFYEALGFDSFKLLERDIPSPELLKRVRAYGERRFDGDLAELLFSYGFGEAPRKDRRWALRHFFRPLQARPSRVARLADLARHQGMLFATGRRPVRIDNRRIPPGFVGGFEGRDCGRLDCTRCGYCERVARDCVAVDEAFREESLRRYAEANELCLSGELWGP